MGSPREIPHVIVVGDIITDVLALLSGPIVPASDTPASISVTGGGAGANTAAWLAATGTRVTLCGVVGTDEAGDARLAELAGFGVSLSVRRIADAATGSIVVLADHAERTMITDRGANLHLSPTDVAAALEFTPDATHLHLSGYALLDEESRPAARYALTAAAEQGLTTSVDAASAGPLRQVGGESFLQWVRGTDVLFANADEAVALLDRMDAAIPVTESAAAGLVRALAPWVGVAVVKLGAVGAISADLGHPDGTTVPAAPANAVDATGAGDAFAAGYLAAWLDGARGAKALEAATAMGARAVARVGARPPRP